MGLNKGVGEEQAAVLQRFRSSIQRSKGLVFLSVLFEGFPVHCRPIFVFWMWEFDVGLFMASVSTLSDIQTSKRDPTPHMRILVDLHVFLCRKRFVNMQKTSCISHQPLQVRKVKWWKQGEGWTLTLSNRERLKVYEATLYGSYWDKVDNTANWINFTDPKANPERIL